MDTLISLRGILTNILILLVQHSASIVSKPRTQFTHILPVLTLNLP